MTMKNTIYVIEARSKKGKWQLCYVDGLTTQFVVSRRNDWAGAFIAFDDGDLFLDKKYARLRLEQAKQDTRRKCRLAAFKITRKP